MQEERLWAKVTETQVQFSEQGQTKEKGALIDKREI